MTVGKEFLMRKETGQLPLACQSRRFSLYSGIMISFKKISCPDNFFHGFPKIYDGERRPGSTIFT